MKTTFGRTCLILGLLSFALAATVSVGLHARHDGVAVPAHSAGMQLQGSSDDVVVASAPEAEKGDRTAACSLRDCPAPKHELALARIDRQPVPAQIDAPQPNEGKAFIAPGDDVQPKSKD